MTSLGKLMRSCGSLRLHFCSRPLLQWTSAAGSVDKVVLLYELKGGKAVAAFGSSDGPNLENWRVSKHMRGHDNQVGPRAHACSVQATAALPIEPLSCPTAGARPQFSMISGYQLARNDAPPCCPCRAQPLIDSVRCQHCELQHQCASSLRGQSLCWLLKNCPGGRVPRPAYVPTLVHVPG